ncbi:MAG TPA: alginate lyase family protein [Opitutaceae bacterium]|nr:alginate lyase family protein [Opitutaceae bacterium]
MLTVRFLPLFAFFSAAAFAADPYLATPREVSALAERAPAALKVRIETIVDKPQPSPSGDPHDYISYARYWWPDPSMPNGLPYVRHDGHHNLDQVAKGDHHRMFVFSDTVDELAAAWATHHDERAARRAGDWLRAWFVTPATRLNPNLDFSQVRLGHNHNRGSSSGLLDGRGLADVVDALRMLQGSPALSASDDGAIHAWFSRYLHWLRTAKNPQTEHAAKNNHGSWFLVQAISIARYCGDDALARQWCEEDKARIASQFRPDGSQPEEIRRVDGLGYSAFNLTAQFKIARLASELGIDLWNYTAPDGGSLRQGYRFLERFNADPSAWPTSQHEKLQPGFLDPLVTQAKEQWKE